MVDYYLPVFMTRRMGGSRYATAGTLIGMVAGFFILPPWGIIICPFLGAFIAELCFNKSREERAFRVAAGAFVAFLLGTGAKVVASATMFYYIIEQMI